MPLPSPAHEEEGEATAASDSTTEDEDHSDLEGGMEDSSLLLYPCSGSVEIDSLQVVDAGVPIQVVAAGMQGGVEMPTAMVSTLCSLPPDCRVSPDCGQLLMGKGLADAEGSVVVEHSDNRADGSGVEENLRADPLFSDGVRPVPFFSSGEGSVEGIGGGMLNGVLLTSAISMLGAISHFSKLSDDMGLFGGGLVSEEGRVLPVARGALRPQPTDGLRGFSSRGLVPPASPCRRRFLLGDNLTQPRRHRSLVEDCRRALKAVNPRLVWSYDSRRLRDLRVRGVVERTMEEEAGSNCEVQWPNLGATIQGSASIEASRTSLASSIDLLSLSEPLTSIAELHQASSPSSGDGDGEYGEILPLLTEEADEVAMEVGLPVVDDDGVPAKDAIGDGRGSDALRC
ncbi:hypothetical protein Dimus_030824 [Dionaea muscipula]